MLKECKEHACAPLHACVCLRLVGVHVFQSLCLSDYLSVTVPVSNYDKIYDGL